MNAREMLNQVRDSVQRLNEAQKRYDRVQQQIEAGRKRGGENWMDTEKSLAELADALDANLAEMASLKRRAVELIAGVKSPRLKEVLELYYLDDNTWEDVAEKMGMSVRHIKRLRDAALEQVE